MKKILVLAGLALFLAGCGGQSQRSKIVDMHNAENALDYQGTYRGENKAGDGIKESIQLEIKKDHSYTLVTKTSDLLPQQETGSYEIKENTLTLTPNKRGVKKSYKVEEGRMIKLDKNNNKEYTLIKD